MDQQIQELIAKADTKRMFKAKIPEPELILLREIASRSKAFTKEANSHNEFQLTIASKAYEEWVSHQ